MYAKERTKELTMEARLNYIANPVAMNFAKSLNWAVAFF